MEESSSETRKNVCRTFANVVKRSPLGAKLDPKAFFMLMSTNFQVLYRDRNLDLEPLWKALSGNHPREELLGLFLCFEQAARELGLSVQQTMEVKDLTPELREIHLRRGSGTGGSVSEVSGLTPLLDISTIDPTAPENVELATADLAPLFPDDKRRAISQAVVQAIRYAPVGKAIQPAQVAYMIDNDFKSLFKTGRFDFRPVYEALRALPNMTDAEIYPAISKLQALLKPLNVPLILPEINVTEEQEKEEAQKRIEETQGADTVRQRIPRGISQTNGRAPSAPASPTGEINREIERTGKVQAFDLDSITTRRSPGKGRVIGLGFVAVLLMAGAAFLLLDRDLDTSYYGARFPLKEARKVSGTFQGVLDESRWTAMSEADREAAAADFESKVKQQGYNVDLQVRDSAGRVVVSSRGADVVFAPKLVKRKAPTQAEK